MRRVRNSEIQSFKTCRWRWWNSYIEKIRPADQTGGALRFGDLVHRALAEFYPPGVRRGPHPAKTAATIIANEGDFNVWNNDDEKGVSARTLAEAMLHGYVEKYNEPDLEWEVVASERTFHHRLRLPAGFQQLGLPFEVVGTLDGIWRHRSSGKYIFKEFKTASAINVDGLILDEQPTMYWTYGPKHFKREGLLPLDADVSEIMYTFLRKAMPDDRPRNKEGLSLNKDGQVSKRQQPALFLRVPVYRDSADRRSLHERVLQVAAEIFATERGEMPHYKNPGPLHMPNCRGCQYRDMCELHETGADWESFKEETMAEYKPYSAHEEVERR